ncbi:MAG: 50S ribosomal protein L40e [archaeon]
MARFPEADKRLFDDMWICIKCNSKQRAPNKRKPTKCRKCGGAQFRVKHKVKKVNK